MNVLDIMWRPMPTSGFVNWNARGREEGAQSKVVDCISDTGYPAPKKPLSNRTPLTSALDGYLNYVRDHRSLRTFRTYRPNLNSFKSFCSRRYVDEVERFSLTSSRPFDDVLAAIKGLQFGVLGQRDDAEEKES
jgi:hypothetical protein